MNEFTKEELQYIRDYIFKGPSSIRYDYHEALRLKITSMIDSYCEHKWRCWDDEHNTRECIVCSEKRTGEVS